MDRSEARSLFSAIDAFLRQGASRCAALSFWRERPCISAREIGMLIALTHGPLCLESLSQELGQDIPATQRLLEALSAVGVVESRGGQYMATPATRLYCQSVAGDKAQI